MAYDPADLRLPPWLLRLFDALVGVRLPVGPNWRLGLTRPGVMYALALLGIWAAAFYSGNNLLYLCGSVLLAISLMALGQGAGLLRRIRLPDSLPELEAGRPRVLRQPVHLPATASAAIDLAWENEAGGFRLLLKRDPEGWRLQGRLRPMRRGVYRAFPLAATEAPLGLFRLERRLHEAVEMLVLPAAMAWQTQGVGASVHRRPGEGDEWHDLRHYVAGDPLSRVHWRRSMTDAAGLPVWMVKRFSEEERGGEDSQLRVDLRLPPSAPDSAFEALLGKVWYWLEQHGEGCLILGSRRFNLEDGTERRRAMQALAEAMPGSEPPVPGEGMLLSLMEGAA